MNELRFTEISEADRNEIQEAKAQIAQAENRLAQVVLKNLGMNYLSLDGDCAIYRYPTELSGNSLEVIRVNGKVVGVYVDPPGVCAAV